MYNINPTLIMGQVMRWLDKSGANIRPHERDRVEIRVYQAEGAGYYFTSALSAIRWYYKDGPDANHFNRADIEDTQTAIESGGKIQICGSRGISYGVWDTFQNFTEETGL